MVTCSSTRATLLVIGGYLQTNSHLILFQKTPVFTSPFLHVSTPFPFSSQILALGKFLQLLHDGKRKTKTEIKLDRIMATTRKYIISYLWLKIIISMHANLFSPFQPSFGIVAQRLWAGWNVAWRAQMTTLLLLVCSSNICTLGFFCPPP